jgi:hypothetical protein
MRVTIEIEMDNTSAMFNRSLFNEHTLRAVDAFKKVMVSPVVYVATEECLDPSDEIVTRAVHENRQLAPEITVVS